MNAFTAVVLCLAVAGASAGHLGLGLVHHVPSGSVSVGANGAVIAGPSGSVHTDNGLHGHGASAKLSGPAGDVATHGGHAHLSGPGLHHEHVVVPHVAPVVHHAAVLAAPAVHHAAVIGPHTHATIVGPSAHATLVGPSAYASVVAPVAHSAVLAAPAWGHHGAWGHQGAWGHHGVVAHGLVGHGHGIHGW